MTARTNTTTHFYVGETVADPLTCQHESGEISLRLVEGVWFTGTPIEWADFAIRISLLTDKLLREARIASQFADQDDFDQQSESRWSPTLGRDRDDFDDAEDEVGDQFADQDDFDQSRADHEALL